MRIDSLFPERDFSLARRACVNQHKVSYLVLSNMRIDPIKRLEAVGFDFSILGGVDDLAMDMSSLLAKVIADESESPEKRVSRDKAYTALRMLLEEIVRIGRYAARNSPNVDQCTLTYKPYTVRKKKEVVTEKKEVEEKAPVAV